MAFRLKEYIKLRNKNISMYVVQEPSTSSNCYSVHIEQDSNFICVLCKSANNKWHVYTHMIPEMMKDVIPLLTSAIDIRILDEEQYLCVN